MSKKRSVSSRSWLREHFKDQYVKQSQNKGLRSRSWFKLEQIQKCDHIFYPGITVLDLGSSPGGWSQYVVQKIHPQGRVIACDLLPMHPIEGVDFFQGDVFDDDIFKKLLHNIGTEKIKVIMSDMAPNISGTSTIDMVRMINLVEQVFKICHKILDIKGNLIVKMFQGEGFIEYLSHLRPFFEKINIRKPDASRLRSREVYIVAKGWKL